MNCIFSINTNKYYFLHFQVFKLYTGYSLKGHMTPVLVFLTNKTLYVTDLIRNRLTNKFVLPYSELDVILVLCTKSHTGQKILKLFLTDRTSRKYCAFEQRSPGYATSFTSWGTLFS